MISADFFLAECRLRGHTFFAGVPCSFLKPLINTVIAEPTVDYVAAASEGEAVAIAAGAHIAGRNTVVMCQNSGLGNTVNPLTSLNYPFRIPTLLIVTMRGEPGIKDEPQHELMGQITSHLLETLHIPWEYFPQSQDALVTTLDRAAASMEQIKLPYALVMRKGSIAESKAVKPEPEIRTRKPGSVDGDFGNLSTCRMSRIQAIETIEHQTSDEDVLIATTGKIGRELFTLGDKENKLYVVGSMGCASGIGFGIQFVRPQQRVVVFDGDGAMLMKLGTLATIGAYQPQGFVHILLDNEAYDSTGGQSTVSPSVDFAAVAKACGYKQCFRCATSPDLTDVLTRIKKMTGPFFVHVKVSKGSATGLGRPELKPFQVKERLMRRFNWR